MFESLLPRHLLIIYEINRRFLREVSVRYLGNEYKMNRMSLIEEGPEKQIRMAHLAIIGSHAVNGVAELHTRLRREKELKDFDELYPGKFSNKTNGVTPRRWLLAANPDLSELITRHIGDVWITDLNQLRKLGPLIDNPDFIQAWQVVKRKNKDRLAQITLNLTGVSVDPASIFDIQVKRIHEYKRQLMNILHVVYCWLNIRQQTDHAFHPRTFFFGGKAVPSYATAKMIIRLICHIWEMINRDTLTEKQIKVVFLPNYRVSLAKKIFPASDVSERISTAGYEASGTSNMKFALNGALTVGTMDGANVEIQEEVGPENIFIFGLTADEVPVIRPSYNPTDYYEKDPVLKQAIDLIREGFFSPEEPGLFKPLMEGLVNEDRFFVLADFESYHQCQMKVDALYRDRESWTAKAILNVAMAGKFSSDRTILEYNRDIWKAEQLSVIRCKREVVRAC